jgi:hypothetical protein
MFKRLSIHLALIFLFVFAQIGAVTHEISHAEDFSKHSQHDKKPHSEQCAQCLSAAQIGSGMQAQPFIFHLAAAEFNTAAFNQLSYSSLTHTAYAARAPPQFL